MRQKFFVPSLATLAFSLALPAAAADLGTVEQTVQSPGGFSASVDVVYATREKGDNFLIIQDDVTGATLVDSDDLGFGWEPGLDARLNFTNGKYGGGLRFYGGFEFDGKKSLPTPPIINFPTDPLLTATGAANAISRYESSLDSVELNVSRDFGPRGAIFVGVRSIMLDEKLTNALGVGVIEASVDFEADTFAIGPQIGGELHFGDRVFLDVDGRIGALVAGSDLTNGVSSFGPIFIATGDHSDWIMAAEGGIAAGFKLSQSVLVRAGYRVLYLDGVPTAPSIINKTNFLTGTIGGAASDDVLVHGVTAGLKVVY